MTGTATEVYICGRNVRLGDQMEVEHATGPWSRGVRIKGTVVELWDAANPEGHVLARLSCGWCFDDHDRIISHIKATQPLEEI